MRVSKFKVGDIVVFIEKNDDDIKYKSIGYVVKVFSNRTYICFFPNYPTAIHFGESELKLL